MFERVIFKNQTGYGPLVDVGALAEALLFYGHVSIIGNTGTIKYLLSKIPPLVFLQLVRDKRITFYYSSDSVAVQTVDRPGQLPKHDLITYSSPQHTIEKVPSEIFYKLTKNKFASRQFSKEMQSIDHGLFDQSAVLESFANYEVTENSVIATINNLTPNYKQQEVIRFRVEQENKGFVVDTNIDFATLNDEYHKVVPIEHSSLTSAYLLSLLQTTQEDLYFAGQLDSEIAVSDLSRDIQQVTINSLLSQRFETKSQIKAFESLTLNSCHSIREAINSGAVPFADLVRLLDKADKFREWLKDQPSEEELINNYYQAIIENTWAEKLPTKSARWGVFTVAGIGIDLLGAGGLGTAAAISLGAFDTFILDKIIGGWKPSHFVEGELKPLLTKDIVKDDSD